MNINSLTGSPRTEASSSPSKPRIAESAGAPTPVKPLNVNESVTFTPAARILNAARDGASVMSFNEEKVTAIKIAIAEGRYPIDNQKLAQKMLDFEHALTRRSSK